MEFNHCYLNKKYEQRSNSCIVPSISLNILDYVKQLNETYDAPVSPTLKYIFSTLNQFTSSISWWHNFIGAGCSKGSGSSTNPAKLIKNESIKPIWHLFTIIRIRADWVDKMLQDKLREHGVRSLTSVYFFFHTTYTGCFILNLTVK